MATTTTTPLHPCFDAEARHSHARVHLPVAPKCNIQCNYCNRQYDCVNESRPGVTSAVLSPYQAVKYLNELDNHLENISVIGIAGPGDPFANAEETIETMRLVKQAFPEKIFCLSTNGLNLKPYINIIADLGVTHVTLTINAVDPEIAAKIYSWVRYDKKVYHGVAGAQIILKNQLECIPLLKKLGIIVKINSIILPGINDHHIPEVAKTVAALGADVINCIPVVPNRDTVFEYIEEPSKKMIQKVRTLAQEHIKMMSHCSRCRADAAGLLGQDFKGAFRMLQEYASGPLKPNEDRPFVAAATHEGILVNMHLGEAQTLYIYKQTPNGFHFMEERHTPEPGSGDFRWINLANNLKDCRAILVAGVGGNPVNILQNAGIRVIQMTGLIDEGLEAVFNGKQIKTIKKPDAFKCGESCRGNAQGCA
jgi:nitrogen fixation protein NifB